MRLSALRSTLPLAFATLAFATPALADGADGILCPEFFAGLSEGRAEPSPTLAGDPSLQERGAELIRAGRLMREELVAFERESANRPQEARDARLRAHLSFLEAQREPTGWELLAPAHRQRIRRGLADGTVTFEDYRALRATLAHPDLREFWRHQSQGASSALDARVSRFLESADPLVPRTLLDPARDFADHPSLRDVYSMSGEGAARRIRTFLEPLTAQERAASGFGQNVPIEAAARARVLDLLGDKNAPLVESLRRREAVTTDGREGALLRAFLAQNGSYPVVHFSKFVRLIERFRDVESARNAAARDIETYARGIASPVLQERATRLLRDLESATSAESLAEWVQKWSDRSERLPQELQRIVSNVRQPVRQLLTGFKSALQGLESEAGGRPEARQLVEALRAYDGHAFELISALQPHVRALGESGARQSLGKMLIAPTEKVARDAISTVVRHLVDDPRLKDVPHGQLEQLLLQYYRRSREHVETLRQTLPSPEYRGFPYGFATRAEYAAFVDAFQSIPMADGESAPMFVFGSAQNGTNFVPKLLPGVSPSVSGIRPFRTESDLDLAVEIPEGVWSALRRHFRGGKFEPRLHDDPPYFQPLHLVFGERGELELGQSDLLAFSTQVATRAYQSSIPPADRAAFSALHGWLERVTLLAESGASWQGADIRRSQRISISFYARGTGALGAAKSGRYFEAFPERSLDPR